MIYLVPTPIGNLGDITIRGKEILGSSNTIICEDTRLTDKLLKLLEIRNSQKLVSTLYHEKFNYTQIKKILEQDLNEPDQIISIVSDAGTPAISDPGYEVMQLILELGLNYTVLPGATAFVPALVASGLPAHEFLFVGFLPLKKGRQTKLKYLSALEEITIIIYESSHRIQKLIEELKQWFNPQGQVFIANDISKLHEKYWKGSVSELDIEKIGEKGEFVIVVNAKI